MNNVKETIIEWVNNTIMYQVFAGEDEHLHLALFDGSINSSRLLNVCVNVTPEDLSDKLKNLSEYWSWNDLENTNLSQFIYTGLHKACKIVEETSIEDKKLIRSTLYENMTENITRAFADIIHPEHIGVKYATIDAYVTDAITYSVYEDEPGRFHLLFYRERTISETEKGNLSFENISEKKGELKIVVWSQSRYKEKVSVEIDKIISKLPAKFGLKAESEKTNI